MRSRDFRSTALELLEDTLIDKELRYVLACYVEENPGFKPGDPKLIADVTGSFNSLLRDSGMKRKGEKKRQTARLRSGRLLPLNSGHHSIIFTENLAAARALAKAIAVDHKKGHLAYDASKQNEAWLKKNIKSEMKRKSVAIIPRNGVTADGMDFMARSDDVLDLLTSYIKENKKVHKAVTGVSLTTTETMMALASKYWQRFVEEYENEATDRLQKLSSSWICIFSFSEFEGLDYLRKFPSLLVEVIRAHDAFFVQEPTGEIISGEKAIIACFKRFLESVRLEG